MSHEKRKKIIDLIDEIRRGNEEKKELTPLPANLDLNLTDESELESKLCETRKKCFRLPSITQTNIDIEELKSYLEDNIDELLGIPFEKDTFKNDDDASDQLTVYEEEANIVQSLLCDYQPNLKSLNIFFTDKLLYTSAETIRRFLEFKLKGTNIYRC